MYPMTHESVAPAADASRAIHALDALLPEIKALVN